MRRALSSLPTIINPLPPENHNAAYGEPTSRGQNGEGRYFGGGSAEGSWTPQFEPRWQGRWGHHGFEGYSASDKIQPRVSAQGQHYRPVQAIAADSQEYWNEAGYCHQLHSSVLARQKYLYDDEQGYGQDYCEPSHYEQRAAYSTTRSEPYYRQEEMYVQPIGYAYEQLPAHHEQQHLTRSWETAKILNANAPTFQPSLTWQAPIDDTSDLKDARLTIAKSAKKIVHVLKRPTPSPEYLEQARRLVQTLESPRQLLIVLDLNGTLVHRKQPRGGSSFVARPKLNEFLQYLFTYHKVMVWSSAKPKNVNAMCEKLFDKDQRQELIAVWARDTLRLPDASYNSKVQVYKQLHWTWHDKRIQAATPDAKSGWDQSNTVLIDDSVEKAASEPHNLICLEEFQNSPEQRKSDVLGQVVKYLELLKHEKDVSAFMQLMPFRYEAGEKFDWRI